AGPLCQQRVICVSVRVVEKDDIVIPLQHVLHRQIGFALPVVPFAIVRNAKQPDPKPGIGVYMLKERTFGAEGSAVIDARIEHVDGTSLCPRPKRGGAVRRSNPAVEVWACKLPRDNANPTGLRPL